VCRLYKKGLTVIEIAGKLGCDRATVYVHLRKGNIRLRPRTRKRKVERWAGYVGVYRPDHPRATKEGYVYEHVIVAERKMKRRLKPNEVVHHVNGKVKDNRPTNLLVLDRAEHMRLHNSKLYNQKEAVIRMYCKENCSLRLIGQRFGIDHTNVAIFLRHHNVPIRRGRQPRERQTNG